MTPTPEPSTREEHLHELLLGYVEAVERGESPDRGEFLARHPEFAGELAEFFAGQDRFDSLAAAVCTPMPPIHLAPVPAEVPAPSFGDYEILEELGRGGMGVVYKARQRSLHRTVALKMILPGRFASSADVQRFRAEAETIGTLDHPHIVPVHAIGEHEGQPFFVMKLVEGGTLARRMSEFGRDPRAAAQLVAKVARAVHYAHQHGVIHRDLKPSNVLLDKDGEPCVGDFGLAKRLTSTGEGSAATPSGALIGTPNYMAPEQAAGRKTGLTTSDVYSLGAVLYELLTGRPPFQADTPVETILQVIEREPERPRSLNRRLDRDLETVCLKCLDKDPRKRYGSAEALAEDLERWLRRDPVRARRAGPAERLWRWCRRNPALAVATGSSAGLLVAIVVITTSLAALWLHERNDALVAERKAQHRLYDAKLVEARSARWSGRPGQRLVALAALAEAARLVPELGMGPDAVLELRNEAIACLTLTDLHLDEQWEIPEYQGYGLAIDPRLERYAFSDGEGNIIVRRIGDHQEIARLPGLGAGQHAYQVRFSPDGKYLAALHHEHWKWRVWDLSRGERPLFTWSAGNGLAFTPDGPGVLLGQDDGGVCLLDLGSGKEVRSFATGLGACETFALDPSGKRLVVSGNKPDAFGIFNLETGQRWWPRLVGLGGLTPVAWSPDGERLATGGGSRPRPVVVWDVQTGQRLVECTGHQRPIQQLAFSRDGDLLVGTGDEYTVRFWEAHTGQQFLSSPGGGGPLQFSPDNQRLALARNGLMVGTWRVSRSREFSVLQSKRASGLTAFSLSVSPDGRLLASGHPDGIRLWDLAFNKELMLHGVEAATWVNFPPKGDLVTAGPAGLFRWPLEPDPSRPGGLRFGRARSLGLPALPDTDRNGCLFPDGQTLAVANTTAGEILAIDLETGARRRLAGGLRNLRHVTVSPNGQWVVTAPYWFPAQPISVWNARTGEHERDLDRVVNGSVTFSPDGKWLVTGSPTEFRFWETGTWARGRVLPRTQGGNSVGNAAFSPDGRLLALTISQNDIHLFDADTGRELALLQSPSPMFVTGGCFSPDGSRLAVATESQGIQSWDLRLIRQQLAAIGLDWDLPPYPPVPAVGDGEPLRVRSVPEGELRPFEGHKGPVAAVAFLPDDRRALSAGRDGTLRLWDLATGKELHHFEGHAGGVVGLAVSADGHALSGGHDHTVCLWDVETGRELKRFTGHTDLVWCVAFSPDGRQALSYGKDCTIRRWDLETGGELWCSPGPAPPPVVGRVAYFPDGERALSVRDKTVRLWDLKAGKELRRFDDRPDVVTASALLPTGRFLLGDTAGKVWLMDAEDGKELRTFSGHRAVISGVAFSHDGRRALSGSLDGTVCLWDLETGESLRTFKTPPVPLHGVAISPDGRRALTASGDGVVRLWDLDGGR